MRHTRTHVPPLDSPSKQLMLDLVRELEQVRVFDSDLKKVHQYERKSFYENLDRVDREREAIHTAALDEVAAFHDRVREEAETTLKAHLRAEEEERLRKEEAARQKEEHRLACEKAEKLRLEREAAARAEAERQARELAEKKAEKKAADEAEAAKKAAALETARKAALEEKLRKERELADTEKRKQEEEAEKAQRDAKDKAQSQQQKQLGAGNLSADDIRVHQRYVELHQTLKEMRKWLKDLSQGQPALKSTIGNMRRSIKKSVGQLRAGPGANKSQVRNIPPILFSGCRCLDTDV
jgi:nucleoporin GLE1